MGTITARRDTSQELRHNGEQEGSKGRDTSQSVNSGSDRLSEDNSVESESQVSGCPYMDIKGPNGEVQFRLNESEQTKSVLLSILLNPGTGDQQSEQTKSILSILLNLGTGDQHDSHLEIWTSTCQLRILKIPQHSTSINLAACSAIQRYGRSLELTPNGPKLQHLVTSTRTWNHQISPLLK